MHHNFLCTGAPVPLRQLESATVAVKYLSDGESLKVWFGELNIVAISAAGFWWCQSYSAVLQKSNSFYWDQGNVQSPGHIFVIIVSILLTINTSCSWSFLSEIGLQPFVITYMHITQSWKHPSFLKGFKHKDVDIISPCSRAATFFTGYLWKVCCIPSTHTTRAFVFVLHLPL